MTGIPSSLHREAWSQQNKAYKVIKNPASEVEWGMDLILLKPLETSENTEGGRQRGSCKDPQSLGARTTKAMCMLAGLVLCRACLAKGV